MSKIATKLTDLIGNTPLLEITNYEANNNLEKDWAKFKIVLENLSIILPHHQKAPDYRIASYSFLYALSRKVLS